MRKLLIMASLFYPQKKGGGPTVSLMNLVTAIQDEFEIIVISHNHEVGEKEPLPGIEDGWNECSFGKTYYFPYGAHTMNNIYNLISEIEPDVIYQNSFFSYEEVLAVLRYKRAHKDTGVVIAPRGELCENRFNDGRAKKTLYTKVLRYSGLLKGVYFQATGDDELTDSKRHLGIDEKWFQNINNFSYADRNLIKEIKKIPGELKLCYIARIQDTKNLLYAVERLKRVRGRVQYDIYGPIENRDYYDKCFAVELPENIKLQYCGMVDHENVGKTISRYHAYYMPTIGENYGHSIVESMLYHRPVVISDKTPWNDINAAGCGFAISLDDELRFEEVLNLLCEMENNEFQDMCSKAGLFISDKLNVDKTIKKYIKCFNEV